MSPKKKKKQPPSVNTEILREQIQLVKAKKEIKLALEKVNEQINKLLVEELQLKSALTLMNTSQSQAEATPKIEQINPVYQFDSVNVINEQKLNLNLLPANSSQSIEEYDDD